MATTTASLLSPGAGPGGKSDNQVRYLARHIEMFVNVYILILSLMADL